MESTWMGILSLPLKMARSLLGKSLSKRSLMVAVGEFAAGAAMRKSREPWQTAENAEAILDRISAYDVARGAGKLITGWLLGVDPSMDAEQAEHRFTELLRELDEADTLPEDCACTRLLLSKALFYLEGFTLSRCRYETLQVQARDLLRKNPKRRNISRREVFLGQPFEPEELIGATHRILLMLAGNQAGAYMREVLKTGRMRDDPDYLARLIALTFSESMTTEPETEPDVTGGNKNRKARTSKRAGVPDDTEVLVRDIQAWCEDYRAFKLKQADQHADLLTTGLAAASGELPAMAGIGLLGQVMKSAFKKS